MRAFQRTKVFINETYEYAFSAVPVARKKSTLSLILIMMGMAFSVSGLTLGADLGNTMAFSKALAACVIGNLFLFLLTLVWGLAGYKSGYTSVYLVKKIIGDKAEIIFSILITVSMITWIGINGDLMARMIVCIFPGWMLPLPVTVLLLVALCVGCVIDGWKSLSAVAKISVPLIVVLTVHNVVHLVQQKGGFGFLVQYQPEGQTDFMAAIVMIVGNFIISTVTIPDLCRFARNKRAVILCAAAYSVFLTVSNVCGIMVAQATEANSLNYGMHLLGMVIPNFVWMLLSTYTTQSVNMYTGSLAVQNLVRGTVMGGNISHSTAVLFIAGLSAILGVTGAGGYLSEIISGMLILSVPCVVIVTVEILMRRKCSELNQSKPLIAWAVCVAAGAVLLWRAGAWASMIQMLVTAVVYTALRSRDRL